MLGQIGQDLYTNRSLVEISESLTDSVPRRRKLLGYHMHDAAQDEAPQTRHCLVPVLQRRQRLLTDSNETRWDGVSMVAAYPLNAS
jgi:hypothetical protein